MSYSPLATYVNLTNNCNKPRNHVIDTLTPHIVVGQVSAQWIADYFMNPAREASCNYGIGKDGDISCGVEEENRSWCTSSRENDNRAITVEIACDKEDPWKVNDAAVESLINLFVDICKRHGKNKVVWKNDKDFMLSYNPKPNEMRMTVHRWFAATGCPGTYLLAKLDYVAEEINKRLSPVEKKIYRVQTGAFGNYNYAVTFLKSVQVYFPDAYMVKSNGLYKIQVGAFGVFENALNYEKTVESKGFDAFITTEKGEIVSVVVENHYELDEFVEDIQRAVGATPDGIAGQETLNKTVTVSATKNARHAVVAPIQKRLYELGYKEVGAADGVAGASFTKAVIRYQKERSLYADGEITAKNATWKSLLEMK